MLEKNGLAFTPLRKIANTIPITCNIFTRFFTFTSGPSSRFYRIRSSPYAFTLHPAFYRLWNEGRGRELLARRAACLGVVLNDVEHSSVLCDLYARIFEGVNIQDLTELDTATAEMIVKNAANVGRIGVQYELLPKVTPKNRESPKTPLKVL